jgi:cellulose synthase operon protein YhjQ
MSVIGVVSMKGGVGKTSVTANLAVAMAKMLGPGRVSAVDLDPQNALHLHLGLETGDPTGVCTQSLAHENWIGAAMDSEHEVRCLPYGEVSEQDRVEFETVLSENDTWIGDQIRAAGLDDDAIVLIDTPPGPSVYLRQVFACADLIVIVLLADAASYATISSMESWMSEVQDQFPHVQSLYLLNQIDRTDLLNKDVTDLLQQRLGANLIPVGIHSDESVREALAFQQPVMAYDPHGQASHDLARLAEYLIDSLNQ